jgi:hypothetical protein
MMKSNLYFLTCILLLFLAQMVFGDGWSTMTAVPSGYSPYHTERYAAGCAVQFEQAGTTATYIYVMGGNYDGYMSMGLSNRVFRYEPWADLIGDSCWSQMANMPFYAYDFGVESGVRNDTVRLYQFGGFDSGYNYRNQIYEYTPLTNTWVYRRNLSGAREGMTQIGKGNGKLYAMGGDNGSSFLSRNEEYDPSNNGLATRTAVPEARGDQAVASVNDSLIFCIGGAYGDLSWAEYDNSNYRYNAYTGSWSTMATRGYVSSGTVAGYYRDIIYNFSGGNEAMYLTHVGRYRVSTNSWLGNGPAMTYIQDGAVCGVVNNFYKPDTFSLISPANMSTVGSLRPTLTWNESERTKGPRIWVITGGTDASTPTARNQAYTIATDTSSTNDTLLYTLWYSTDVNFTPTDSINDLTSESYTFTFDLAPSTRYYWKVRRNDYYEGTERWSKQLDWWFETPAVSIELSTFHGWVENGIIKLGWRTESEDDNVLWRIERAFSNLDDFALIGTVEGQGTKPGPTEYAFADPGALKRGWYYYRIGDVNSQGHTTWHGPIGIDLRTTGESRFSVLPRSGGTVEVSYTINAPVDVSIELYDISGRVVATLFNGRRERGRYAHVWSGVAQNGMRVRSGVYFCRLRTAVDTKTVKFVYMR